jgi:hypothetical protein
MEERYRQRDGGRQQADIFVEWRGESFARNQFLDQSSILKLIDEETLADLIAAGKIYGIPDHDKILYPAYQFDPVTHFPYDEIEEMIDEFGRESEWEVHIFAEMPMISLGNKSVSELLYLNKPKATKAALQQLRDFIERYGNKRTSA